MSSKSAKIAAAIFKNFKIHSANAQLHCTHKDIATISSFHSVSKYKKIAQVPQHKFLLPNHFQKCHYKMLISNVVLQLKIMTSAIILGPVCDVSLFLQQTLTQKCITREKSRQIKSNAKTHITADSKIHGFCKFLASSSFLSPTILQLCQFVNCMVRDLLLAAFTDR